MRWCARCENCRWVCEEPSGPTLEAVHACACGGAGAPCPMCNAADELTPPDMPERNRHREQGLEIVSRERSHATQRILFPASPPHSPVTSI
jgi:hypothetical protein